MTLGSLRRVLDQHDATSSQVDQPFASVGMLSLCASTILAMASHSRSLSSSVSIEGSAAMVEKAFEYRA